MFKDVGAAAAAGRIARCACAVVLALGLGGCSLVETLTTPTLDELEEESVEAVLDGSSLVEEGVLTVAVDTSDAPQAMTDSSGDVVGYDVDVALALAKRLGLSVKIVDATSASSSVGEGLADIYIGSSSSNVGSDFASTDVYLQDATALFTDSSVTTVASVSTTSLESATVAVQEESASQDALVKAGIAAEQVTYSNVNECFEALVAGEVDFVACDATAGAYLARMYADIEFVGTISSTSSFCITMLESNEALVEAVCDAFDGIDADGTLDAIHTLWYGSLPTELSGELVAGISITDSDGEETTSTDDDSEIVITGDINSID